MAPVQKKASPGQELADQAKDYIGAHFTERYSLERMAKALFINPVYLAKTFKKHNGITPLHYHNLMRCEEAGRLLKTTALPMEVIASRVGFATHSHFSKIFREIKGVTPSQYRRAVDS